MSPPVYLFRYRDLLTTDTLGDHRAIIDDGGSCWWGWWQLPGEQTRLDAWEALARSVKAGPVQIGLFNSDPAKDADQIHWATLTEIVPPQGGSAPKLPDGETGLVPEYYRETPFSSAWMRLTKIEASAEAGFFGRFTFAEAPQLRGISESQSRRFVGKLVLDAEELRTMDTTIWKVRPQEEGDRQERILTATAGLTGALSNQPVSLGGCKILHISDLHFATLTKMRQEHRWGFINEDQITLHERILSALGKSSGIGLVVISGDITHIAADEEFYEAFRFIHGLLGALQLGPEHLVIVPGNHDIGWSRQKEEVWNPQAQVEPADEEAMAPFRRFYERVFRHPASPCLGMARRFVLPNGLTLEVGGLNSSGLKYGQNYLAGMGRLPDGAFDEIRTELGWSDAPSLALRLLVHHHHLSATEDVLPTAEFSRGFGMSVDAKQTLRKAARHGVQLVLHGHRHQPYLGAEQVYAELERTQPKYSLGRVGIVGGGSAGSTSVTNDTNFFNVLDLRSSGISLKVYSAQSKDARRESFEPIKTFFAPFRSETGQLILGDWESETAKES